MNDQMTDTSNHQSAISDRHTPDGRFAFPVRRVLSLALVCGSLAVLVTLGDSHGKTEKPHFSDVPDDHPAAAAVYRLAALGLVQGSGGRFRGDALLTDPEALVLQARFAAYVTLRIAASDQHTDLDRYIREKSRETARTITRPPIPRGHWAFPAYAYLLLQYPAGSKTSSQPPSPESGRAEGPDPTATPITRYQAAEILDQALRRVEEAARDPLLDLVEPDRDTSGGPE